MINGAPPYDPMISGLAFSGSYRPGEVQFLLKPIQIEPMPDLHAKERLIQSGARHYSEMLGVERQPSAQYMALFYAAVQSNAAIMARDVWRLAAQIHAARPGGATLVSLARAGTPVGVLLHHVLREFFGCVAAHYSISIIRDRGIDEVALDYICARHAPESLVFIDGWTGKGAIANELRSSLKNFAARSGVTLADELYVLCDLAGLATAAGSTQDYLIPSAILNATVSGLVSRSVLNEQIGAQDFHGCRYYSEFVEQDRSVWFIEQIMTAVRALPAHEKILPPPHDCAKLRVQSSALLERLMREFEIDNRNYIKPGIGEATRALLRRTPRVLLLSDLAAPEVQHLRLLAQESGVPIQFDPESPLHAAAIIQRLSDA
jgi:hypothetical protein